MSAIASDRARLADLVLLVPAPLFWAGNFIIGRAMRGQLPPFAMSFLRWGIALLVLLPFALPRMRRDAGFYRAHPRRMLALSLTGIVAFNSFVYVGLRSTSAANALLLNSTIPALIMLFGALLYRQPLHGRQVAGLVLSLAGVATIVLQGAVSHFLALSFSRGDVIVFGGMIAWAFYTLWLRVVPVEIDRIGFLCAQIILAMPVLAVMALGEAMTGARPVWSTASVAAIGYIGIFPSVIAYLAYNMGVARVGPAVAGLSIHLLPAFGVVLAILVLGEPFHLYHAAGIVLILCGLILASIPRRPSGPA